MVKLDSYEVYLTEVAKIIRSDIDNVHDDEQRHKVFSQEIHDEKLLAEVNRILKEDTQLPVENIVGLDVAQAKEALMSRLKCRRCDPTQCDGFVYRLENHGGRVVGSWYACPVWYKHQILIPDIEARFKGQVQQVLKKFGVSRLEELSIKQLQALRNAE